MVAQTTAQKQHAPPGQILALRRAHVCPGTMHTGPLPVYAAFENVYAAFE